MCRCPTCDLANVISLLINDDNQLLDYVNLISVLNSFRRGSRIGQKSFSLHLPFYTTRPALIWKFVVGPGKMTFADF